MIDIDKLISKSMKMVKNDPSEENKCSLKTMKLIKAKILEFKTMKNAPKYDEAAEISLLSKMIRERRESAQMYLDSGRDDLCKIEEDEIQVIGALLPKMPTREDIEKYLDERYPNGVGKREMGIAIKEVKGHLVGADGKLVSEIVKSRLVV